MVIPILVEGFYKRKVYHGHDLLMTEDNVKVPLAISGLGKSFDGKVCKNLSSLIDIVPTIQTIINPNIKFTLNQKFFDSGVNLFSNQRKHLQVYNRYIFQKNQQIKFISKHNKFIKSSNKFYSEKNGKLETYLPNKKELQFVDNVMLKIKKHFQSFIESKLEKLPINSILFSSYPPSNFACFFNKKNKFNIKFSNKLDDATDISKILILKSSENIFQTLTDIKKVKKIISYKQNIKILSLNLDVIEIENNAFEAYINLFKNKFVPRFFANPYYAIKQVLIVLKKIWLKQ